MTTAYVALEALNFAAELLESIYDAGEQSRSYYVQHLREPLQNIDWIEVARSVAQGLTVAALMAYEAGRLIGTAVYRASEYLGSAHKGLIGVAASEVAAGEVVATAPVAAEVAPNEVAATAPSLELEYLTCKQLRELLGNYKPKATKKQLLEMAYALPA